MGSVPCVMRRPPKPEAGPQGEWIEPLQRKGDVRCNILDVQRHDQNGKGNQVENQQHRADFRRHFVREIPVEHAACRSRAKAPVLSKACLMPESMPCLNR